jgi:hypothetical protein
LADDEVVISVGTDEVVSDDDEGGGTKLLSANEH